MPKKILNELSSNFNHLSNTERKIARLILDDPESFITYSMGQLSEKADVSQGSIINFSNKYAGGGFPALKLLVAAGISEHREPAFSAAVGSDGIKDTLIKTVSYNTAALENTVAFNDEAVLKSAAERILSSKKVEIFGLYRSAVVASNLHFQLLQLGIPASYVSDVLTNAVSASMLDSDCLVIAISNSGRTKDVIDAVKVAKDRGVPIISITSNRNSPLARLSDDTLIASSSGRTVSGLATEVQISQLILADALCTYLQNRIDSGGEERYWALRSILGAHNVED